MRDGLLKLIPEFGLIEDDELREKTIRAWEQALRAGGWHVDDIERMPFTLIIDPCPCNMVEHVRAVTRIARAAAETLLKICPDRVSLNMDYLTAGALLHDIGKLIEYKREGNRFVKSRLGSLVRHPISGVGICYKEGLPDEVLHIVASHSWEGDRLERTPESIIIHHADFITFEQFK